MLKIGQRIFGFFLNSLAVIYRPWAAAFCVRILSAPIRKKYSSKQLDYLSKSKKVFNYKGHKVSYYVWGNGDTKVLFNHGWRSNAYRWKNYVERLDLQKFTVIAVDALAHGDSESKTIDVKAYAEIIETLIQEYKVEILIGHSFGGLAGMYACYLYPDQIKKLIIMASPCDIYLFFGYFVQHCKLSKNLQEAVLSLMEEKTGHHPDFYRIENFAPALKMEGIIVHDPDDHDVPFTHAERLHQHWAKAKLIPTKNKGHRLRHPDVEKLIVDYISN